MLVGNIVALGRCICFGEEYLSVTENESTSYIYCSREQQSQAAGRTLQVPHYVVNVFIDATTHILECYGPNSLAMAQ